MSFTPGQQILTLHNCLQLGLRSKRLGPRKGREVQQAEPLGWDAGGGGSSGRGPPWPDPERTAGGHQDRAGQPHQDTHEL